MQLNHRNAAGAILCRLLIGDVHKDILLLDVVNLSSKSSSQATVQGRLYTLSNVIQNLYTMLHGSGSSSEVTLVFLKYGNMYAWPRPKSTCAHWLMFTQA